MDNIRKHKLAFLQAEGHWFGPSNSHSDKERLFKDIRKTFII